METGRECDLFPVTRWEPGKTIHVGNRPTDGRVLTFSPLANGTTEVQRTLALVSQANRRLPVTETVSCCGIVYFESSTDRGRSEKRAASNRGAASAYDLDRKHNRCPSYAIGGAFYVHRGCCLAPIFITESGCTEQFREASCGSPATVPSKESHLKSAHADRYHHLACRPERSRRRHPYQARRGAKRARRPWLPLDRNRHSGGRTVALDRLEACGALRGNRGRHATFIGDVAAAGFGGGYPILRGQLGVADPYSCSICTIWMSVRRPPSPRLAH